MFERGVAVTGTGYSKVERRSSRSLGDLTLEAIGNACANAGIEPGEIDGLATFPDNPSFGNASIDGIDVVSVHHVARRLGLVERLRWNSQCDALIQGSMVDAINAVASGTCETVIVFRAMHNPTGGAYNAFTADRAVGGTQFAAPFGVHRGYQTYGQAYRRYMWEYGATREHMATLILNGRRNAALNSNAYFSTAPALTVQDYLDARMLADPVCLLDCDIPVDGAVALVLTSATRARHAQHGAAHLAGYAQSVGRGGTSDAAIAIGLPLSQLQENGRVLAERLWAATGLRPTDVDVAQLYDGYSFFVYWWLEALGFCGRGEAFEFIQDGRIALEGQLPVNTFGGQLGEGRLHGIGHLAEAIRQAAGTAGDRQVPGVGVSVAALGPLSHISAAFVFTSEPK